MKKLFTLMGLFALSFSFAQEIYLLDDYLKMPAPGAQYTMGNQAIQDPAKIRLKSLLFDLVPGIAVTSDKEYQNFKAGSELPSVLRIDAADMGKFASLASNTASVEAIIISLAGEADFNQKFSAAYLEKLPQLKYVFFDAGTATDAQSLANMLQGEFSGITFLYRVSPRG